MRVGTARFRVAVGFESATWSGQFHKIELLHGGIVDAEERDHLPIRRPPVRFAIAIEDFLFVYPVALGVEDLAASIRGQLLLLGRLHIRREQDVVANESDPLSIWRKADVLEPPPAV